MQADVPLPPCPSAYSSQWGRACKECAHPDVEGCVVWLTKLIRRYAPSFSYLRKDFFFSSQGYIVSFSMCSITAWSVPYCIWRSLLFPSFGQRQQHRELKWGGKKGYFQISNLQVNGRIHGQKGMPSITVCDAEWCGSVRYRKFGAYENYFSGITTTEI